MGIFVGLSLCWIFMKYLYRQEINLSYMWCRNVQLYHSCDTMNLNYVAYFWRYNSIEFHKEFRWNFECVILMFPERAVNLMFSNCFVSLVPNNVVIFQTSSLISNSLLFWTRKTSRPCKYLVCCIFLRWNNSLIIYCYGSAFTLYFALIFTVTLIREWLIGLLHWNCIVFKFELISINK